MFTEDQIKDLRGSCLKSLFSIILKNSEHKSLLDCKTLCFIGQACTNSYFSTIIGSILIKNIYKRSTLLPQLLSILGLLLQTSENKQYKDALIQVFKKMKENAEDQTDSENKLKLQPESFTPYLFFVIAKCNLQFKLCHNVLNSYLACLFKSHEKIDFNYLMFVAKQLQKFSVAGKTVNTELNELPSTGIELEKILNEFCLILAQNYIPKDYVENYCKVLIPTSYFFKQKQWLSPDLNVKEGSSGLKRRLVDTSPNHKQFKM